MSLKPTPGARILVVDDMPEMRQLASLLLERAGYVTLLASGGEEGLIRASEELPDLILLDVMMPGLDGYEVCQRLKAQESTREIPVIFMSAGDDVQAQTLGFEAGAADYVVKPFSTPVLLARVRTHVSLHAQRRSLEGMFRDALEFAPDAIVLSDVEGRIVHVNARTLELFGYLREELIGQTVGFLIPPYLRADRDLKRQKFVDSVSTRPLHIGGDEMCLRKDGSEFPGDVNLSNLKSNRGRLLMAVIRDVSESRRIQQEMTDSRQRLREMAARADAMREYERKNMAREVHDELGQVLTALRMDLTFSDLQFGAQSSELREKIRGMRALVDRAIQGVRHVAAHLRPMVLDMGLVPAIEWVCSEFSQHAAIPCSFEVDIQAVEVVEQRAIGLFRIVQESLTNVTRYAKATSVQVSLRRDDDQLLLQIRDDGQGFDVRQVTECGKSFGLLGMQERALALGGQLEVVSAPGQGTTILVRIPLHQGPIWQEESP